MPLSHDTLRAALACPLVETDLPLGERYRGKVRDTYALGADRLVLVTTDRVSAFDCVFGEGIPFKGQVLNRLAAHFFRATEDVAPNALLGVPHGNVAVHARCDVLPFEFVVRGYLAGHALRTYQSGQRVLCGEPLPEGLRAHERLPAPLLTPATKAAEGHDEDISRADMLARGLIDAGTLEEASAMAFALFARGTEMAAARGLILVDTKYEFGRAPDGRLVVVDEIHTPDSSRYWLSGGYDAHVAAGTTPRQLSKEFLREWLLRLGFSGQEGQPVPALPDEMRLDVAARYVELYETLTGEAFVPDPRPLAWA